MMGLVIALAHLFKDKSEAALSRVNNIKHDINKVRHAPLDDVGALSRIANNFPDFYSPSEINEWYSHAADLMSSVEYKAINSDESVAAIVAALEDYAQANLQLELTHQSKELVIKLYHSMIRNACRNVLQTNGDLNSELASILQLDDVVQKYNNDIQVLNFELVQSVCANVLMFKLLQDTQKINSVHGNTPEYEIKQALLVAFANIVFRDKDMFRQQLISILEERKLLQVYIRLSLETGEYDAKIYQILKSNIDDSESKIHGFFSRLAKKSEERVFEFIGKYYPEMMEDEAAKAMDWAKQGEAAFVRLVNMLMMSGHRELAYKALYPRAKSGSLPQVMSDENIRIIYHNYYQPIIERMGAEKRLMLD